MNAEVGTTTSVAFVKVTPHALKHTSKYSEHEPVDSPLLAREMASLFHEKIAAREGDRLPAVLTKAPASEGLRVYMNSQTSINTFREMIADIEPGGTLTVFHVLEHSTRADYERQNEEMKKLPRYYVVEMKAP